MSRLCLVALQRKLTRMSKTRFEPERSDSPAPSNVSMKSDRSKDDPPCFSKAEPRRPESERPVSPAPSNVSMKSDKSKDNTPDFTEPRSTFSADDPLDFTAESSRTSKETDQDEQDIRKVVKKRILNRYEEQLRGHETDTKLYEIQALENAKAKAQKCNELFRNSKKENVRTVLMKGVAGVGKTFQTKSIMVDWAKGKSNKEIDLIVSFHFDELNSRKEVQSLKDLICDSLDDDKHRVDNYDKRKVAFVLDGLEECKLPLDFAKNMDLTDIEEPASMDVLLTNLIKGKLLPSALLWIISRPSGYDKIPSDYIDKVTECRETSKRREKLTSALRDRFRETTQKEDVDHPNQKNTEHVMTEDRSGDVSDEEKVGHTEAKSVTRVKTGSDIFKDAKRKKIRTVLTTGESGIGKSFHVQKFITD
ncbi:uncharacterized protein PEZ65_008751 [Lycodopsis pacificus]